MFELLKLIENYSGLHEAKTQVVKNVLGSEQGQTIQAVFTEMS